MLHDHRLSHRWIPFVRLHRSLFVEQAEQRIRVWLEEGQQKTAELLLQHKTFLQEIAGQLLEKESLYADEIDFLFK